MAVRLSASRIGRLSRENVWASTPHNQMGFLDLLQGQLYLFWRHTDKESEWRIHWNLHKKKHKDFPLQFLIHPIKNVGHICKTNSLNSSGIWEDSLSRFLIEKAHKDVYWFPISVSVDLSMHVQRENRRTDIHLILYQGLLLKSMSQLWYYWTSKADTLHENRQKFLQGS
jgi:hypothetical protein